MGKWLTLGLCVVTGLLHAQEKTVQGEVTYLTSEVVYTSLGRNAGVEDSTHLYVMAGPDTAAVLRVFAVSSSSSASRVISSRRPVRLNDVVSAFVPVRRTLPPADTLSPDTTSIVTETKDVVIGRIPRTASDGDWLSISGRVSGQYFGSFYNNAAFNIAQPGIVINVRGTFREVPLRFETYAKLRSLAVGRNSPFGSSARNQSRIYGLSISYDDGGNVFTLGRIIPSFSPSIGYIDGAMFATRMGDVEMGTAFGFQPDLALRGVSGEYKKAAVFVRYSPVERASFSVSGAYARTYYHSTLDREAASLLLNAPIASDLFFYANTEVDLRRKSGSAFRLSPSLTTFYANLSYRVTRSFSVGVGADASRPYYSYQSIRSVPDSLLVNDLRTGASVNISWQGPAGMSVYNTFNPRSSTLAFGKEFANYSSVGFANVFGSGVNVRSTLNLNSSRYTNGTGFGGSLQRTFSDLVDVNLRFVRNSYTVKQTDQRNISTTLGTDVMVFLSRSLMFFVSYDRLDGYGTVSNSVFAELSVRF